MKKPTAIILAILIITILSKLFPVIPIWELKEDIENETNPR